PDDVEEFLTVCTSQVRDRTDAALAPDARVRKRRDVAHVDDRTDHASALVDGSQGERNEGTHGRVDNGRIERRGRQFGRLAAPRGAEFAGEHLRFAVTGTHERVDFPALPDADLREDVRGGAEAVQA